MADTTNFIHEFIEEDIFKILDPEYCVQARISYGGPRFELNKQQCKEGAKVLTKQKRYLKIWEENK